MQSKNAATTSATSQPNEIPTETPATDSATSDPSVPPETQGGAGQVPSKTPTSVATASTSLVGNGTSATPSGSVSLSGSTGALSTSSGGSASGSGGVGTTTAATAGEPAPIRAPASLWRCSRIMHLLRDLRPTLLSALEGIVDQVGVTCKNVLVILGILDWIDGLNDSLLD